MHLQRKGGTMYMRNDLTFAINFLLSIAAGVLANFVFMWLTR